MKRKKSVFISAVILYALMSIVVRYSPEIVNLMATAGALIGGLIGYVIGRRQK